MFWVTWLISAFLTHRKHQIGIKRIQTTCHFRIQIDHVSTPATDQPRSIWSIQNQIKLHFQFLIQNLALSNEIEGGKESLLLSLKLLVQLHLHLDSVCNLRVAGTSATSNVPTPSPGISCLNALNHVSILSNHAWMNWSPWYQESCHYCRFCLCTTWSKVVLEFGGSSIGSNAQTEIDAYRAASPA